jgi:hypothetical protein
VRLNEHIETKQTTIPKKITIANLIDLNITKYKKGIKINIGTKFARTEKATIKKTPEPKILNNDTPFFLLSQCDNKIASDISKKLAATFSVSIILVLAEELISKVRKKLTITA